MKIEIHTVWGGWLCIVALLAQGCVAPTYRLVEDKMTPAELAQLGHIEIVVVDQEPSAGFISHNLDKKDAALAYGIGGALFGGVMGAILTSGYGIIVEVVIGGAITCGVGGAIYGFYTGDDKEGASYTRKYGADIIRAIKAHKYLTAQIAKSFGKSEFQILDEPSLVDTPESTYAFLFKSGTFSILEVVVDRIGIDNDAVYARSHIHLRRAQDGATLYKATYYYITSPTKRKDYDEWGRQRSALHAEFLNAIDRLAAAVVQDVNLQGKTPKLPLWYRRTVLGRILRLPSDIAYFGVEHPDPWCNTEMLKE
jgi:hypothetical protein